MNILHIHASSREDGSHSWHVARAFIDRVQLRHADVRVDSWNVFEETLPEVNNHFLAVKTKVANGETLENGEKVLWTDVENAIARIKGADVLVLSVPMWNFGVPYRLKQLVDVVTQYGYLFSMNESGFVGLLSPVPTVVVQSRGGAYGEGTGAEAFDQQTPYLRTILGFWGLTAPEFINVESTMSGGDAATASKAEAVAQAEELADTLA